MYMEDFSMLAEKSTIVINCKIATRASYKTANLVSKLKELNYKLKQWNKDVHFKNQGGNYYDN